MDQLLRGNYYSFLQAMDKKSVENINCLVTVSKAVQERAKNIYGKNSMVLYPPVKLPIFAETTRKKDGYYCYAGRLSKEKNVLLLIETFNINKLPLLIVGEGKEKEHLKRKAKKNIKFLGFKNYKNMFKILASAKAFIHVAPDDDFPLTPVQALGCGTPVITYQDGGTKEALIIGKTGIVFRELTAKSLNEALVKFQKMTFNYNLCRSTANKYSESQFKTAFLKILRHEYQKFQEY